VVSRLLGRASNAGRRIGVGVLAAIAALVTCVVVLRPFGPATIDPDSATSVLYFRYIVSGHHLEAFVPTTPKPLLTVLYGVTWNLTHDWRVPVLETIAAFALAVSFAARLAERLAGPFAAGFAVLGLLAWPEMLAQVAHANSLPWAVAGWLGAGVAVSGDRSRPRLAGLALLLAGLARLETVWIIAAGGLGIALLALRARQTGQWDVVRAGMLTVGLAAVAGVVMCLHDWLLTGNPLYWASVPSGYTAIVYPDGLQTLGLKAFLENVTWSRYSSQGPLLILAFAGLVKLAVDRRWSILAALVALPVGVTATLALLARRGIFYTDRYWDEADVALLLGAAIGSGFLVEITARRLGSLARAVATTPFVRRTSLIVAGALAALVLAWAPLSTTDLQASLSVTRNGSANLASISARLALILQGATGAVTSVSGVELPLVDVSSVRLFVPRPDVARVAVETGALYSEIGDNYLAFRYRPPEQVLRAGQWVYHDRWADSHDLGLPSLEQATPTSFGQVVLVPIVSDARSGVWLTRAGAKPT
jgi:hypothetical protein